MLPTYHIAMPNIPFIFLIRLWRTMRKSEKSKMAERTGLEPATPGVTGRYSNQLNYRSVRCAAPHGGRLLVGVAGVEPATYGL